MLLVKRKRPSWKFSCPCFIRRFVTIHTGRDRTASFSWASKSRKLVRIGEWIRIRLPHRSAAGQYRWRHCRKPPRHHPLGRLKNSRNAPILNRTLITRIPSRPMESRSRQWELRRWFISADARRAPPSSPKSPDVNDAMVAKPSLEVRREITPADINPYAWIRTALPRIASFNELVKIRRTEDRKNATGCQFDNHSRLV